VYHVSQDLPIEQARALVHDAEARFRERARVQLAAFVAALDPPVVAAGMAAATAKPAPPLEKILKVHPLVHAAEGELYRRVFSEASAAIGFPPPRMPADALGRKIADALGLTPEKVAARLAEMGKASGRPWTADQKNASLAAWYALIVA
jgi:hypothetical protein